MAVGHSYVDFSDTCPMQVFDEVALKQVFAGPNDGVWSNIDNAP
ncbi:hypothetical protein PRUB_b1118 [Pseudoalteromonas rubra]|uniref:Uncharacterized protein n=1 Tax=Pseudoalteromonas rubra TaxID=43658 RepID=A0A8T0C1M7_9GAMM|nr:hypothetical protein PRUB_b1118 [Pseudoalteromonas rubra]